MSQTDPPTFPHSDELKNSLLAIEMQLNDSEFDILVALAESDHPLEPAEVESRVDYSQSTVYRGLNTLSDELGIHLQESGEGYYLSDGMSIALQDYVEYTEAVDEYVESNPLP